MRSDLASIARRPVKVTIGGREFQLPYRPAAEWVTGLDRLEFLVTHLADQDTRDAIVDMRLEDARVRDELKAESLRILEEQGGRAWWEVGRLLATSVGDTETLGQLVLAGADPWQRSVAEWAAAVYALCMKGQDTKGRMRFEVTLAMPPPGYEDKWDDGNDVAALSQAYARALGKK